MILVLAVGVSEARADKKKAMEHWNRGNTAYTLAKFDAAIGHFEKAYVEHPAPAFLFNIAQCHRQLKDCDKAAFFYRRYLSAKPDAENRSEVEGYIAEMEQLCAAKTEPKVEPKVEPKTEPKTEPEPARVAMRSDAGGGDGSAVIGGGADAGLGAEAEVDDALLAVRVQVGPTWLKMGELDVPVQTALQLAIGYPLRFGSIAIEPGVVVQNTAISYEDASSGTANLLSVAANVPVGYFVTSKLRVRGELAVGVLLFSGLAEGNPFTEGGRGTTGALSMLYARVAVGVDYAITRKLIASVTPLALASSPAKEGLQSSIDSIASFDALAGLGYRF